MTKDSGLSYEEVEEKQNLVAIKAKVIGKITGDVFYTRFAQISSEKEKFRFIDQAEHEYYKSTRESPIWEKYELIFKVWENPEIAE